MDNVENGSWYYEFFRYEIHNLVSRITGALVVIAAQFKMTASFI